MNPHMEDWYIQCTSDNFTAPEVRAYRIVGIVSGHPLVGDGRPCQTSQVQSRVTPGSVNTQSRTYTLGTPAAHQKPLPQEGIDPWDRDAAPYITSYEDGAEHWDALPGRYPKPAHSGPAPDPALLPF